MAESVALSRARFALLSQLSLALIDEPTIEADAVLTKDDVFPRVGRDSGDASWARLLAHFALFDFLGESGV
jgi:hypothetical protein